MKNALLLLFCLICFTFCYSQDKTLDLFSFTSINVSAGIEVELVPGGPSAELTMKKGDIEELLIEQSGSDLKIKFKKQKWSMKNNNRKAYIKLYYDMDISEVEVSAGASVKGKVTMKVEDFDAEASSGGSISMSVECEDADIEVSSGGSVLLEGVAEDLSVEASSGGSFSGKNMEADSVDAEASSGGSATVWVTKSIVASTSSGGSIKYKGEPKKENIDAGRWSGGSIRKI